MEGEIQAIVEQFSLEGAVTSTQPFGGGHINDTYLITSNGTEKGHKYILQKINTYVFRNPIGLMNNMDLVTRHIRQKLHDEGIEELDRRSLRLMSTVNGGVFFENDQSEYWRIFNFIDDHIVFDGHPSLEIAYEGARMFGNFIWLLADLDPVKIVDTIPDFHNLRSRMSQLENAVKQDPKGRLKFVKSQLRYVRNAYELMSTIQVLGEKGLLAPRIVHNDTKINNVLFDQDQKGLCVVDLDTVMPGYVHYDFGDGIRTCANNGSEDDPDLKKVSYNLDIISAFAEGFVDAARNILNEHERASLAHAALLFPFIMGVRFLTDYVAGDVYYKIQHEDHNLIRARAQLKLAQDGEAKLQEMQSIIDKL